MLRDWSDRTPEPPEPVFGWRALVGALMVMAAGAVVVIMYGQLHG